VRDSFPYARVLRERERERGKRKKEKEKEKENGHFLYRFLLLIKGSDNEN
jgi:hypothetical protein